MEITLTDLAMVKQMFQILSQAAEVKGVWEVKIIFKSEGGDAITIGYGEQGVPAILDIKNVDSTPAPIPIIHINPAKPLYPYAINKSTNLCT